MGFFEVKWEGDRSTPRVQPMKRLHHHQLMENLGEELMVQNTVSQRVNLRERRCEG